VVKNSVFFCLELIHHPQRVQLKSTWTFGRTPFFFMVVAAAVVAALASSVALLPAASGTRNTGSGPNSVSAVALSGLNLTLRISNTEIPAGGSITINVTESNTLTKPLNISAGRNWPVPGLRMSACYSSVYPFGVAVYQGHYSKENISGAKPLNLYPLVPCPLLLRYISGYDFAPKSDSALILPGTGSPLRMTAGLIASGNYTSGTRQSGFNPGEYTVAAGDEWGTLVLLYFAIP
jgi:hypothetical protein